MNDEEMSCRRRGFTLVELIVVMAIIGIIVSIALPALNIARSSSRTAKCQMNLKQIGVALLAHSERSSKGKLCTGAFDWINDGVVTEVGWVADLVNSKAAVGKMLCPSNPYQISETYVDLMTADTTQFDNCVDRAGRARRLQPDGTPVINPCRLIIESALPAGSVGRNKLIMEKVYKRHYNTNYTASWYLVRGDVEIGDSGNLVTKNPNCPAALSSLNSTRGPLTIRYADSAQLSTSFIPLLGDGAPSRLLPYDVGDQGAGTFTVRAYTKGPVLKTTMGPPTFPDGTPSGGLGGWWAVWKKQVLQDYRAFSPLHGGLCVVVFADGSVRRMKDTNRDGLLNNGFLPSAANGFESDEVELPLEEFSSLYSLRAKLE